MVQSVRENTGHVPGEGGSKYKTTLNLVFFLLLLQEAASGEPVRRLRWKSLRDFLRENFQLSFCFYQMIEICA